MMRAIVEIPKTKRKKMNLDKVVKFVNEQDYTDPRLKSAEKILQMIIDTPDMNPTFLRVEAFKHQKKFGE